MAALFGSSMGAAGAFPITVSPATRLDPSWVPLGSLTTITPVSTTPHNVTTTAGTLILLCDATAAGITVNLPTITGNTAVYRIKKTDASANTVTIDPAGAETVEGAATATLTTQYESIDLACSASGWHVL
jgi:hypothetical protein